MKDGETLGPCRHCHLNWVGQGQRGHAELPGSSLDSPVEIAGVAAAVFPKPVTESSVSLCRVELLTRQGLAGRSTPRFSSSPAQRDVTFQSRQFPRHLSLLLCDAEHLGLPLEYCATLSFLTKESNPDASLPSPSLRT